MMHRSSGSGHSDYLSDEKENYSEESNGALQHENELKRKMFENLKRAGVLDGMKSSLRGQLYERLRLKGDKPLRGGDNQLSFKIASSLIADLM
jgi:LisH